MAKNAAKSKTQALVLVTQLDVTELDSMKMIKKKKMYFRSDKCSRGGDLATIDVRSTVRSFRVPSTRVVR
jgi:hypothetical protein